MLSVLKQVCAGAGVCHALVSAGPGLVWCRLARAAQDGTGALLGATLGLGWPRLGLFLA